MGKPKRLCYVCKARPATVPDRNTMGRPIARVCAECHAERLREDLRVIHESWARATKKAEDPR